MRTCDIGADKTVDYMKLDHEDNPALGYRAIRICLTRKDFFKTQLRALLRASAYGNMSIMFPMITSLRELQDAKAVLEECRAELTAEGVKMGQNIEVGTMIETPAAVLMADELAAECDFFSIGTNDLTQYTCALDRQNAKLEPFFNPHHPAVLRAIKMTIEAGHRHGIWVGICGELGADTHDVIDNIENDFIKRDGLQVTIHYDPIVTTDAAVGVLRTRLMEKARQLDPCLSIHDLRIVPGDTHTNVLFDLEFPAGYTGNKDEMLAAMCQFVHEQDPKYSCVVKVEQSYASAAHEK